MDFIGTPIVALLIAVIYCYIALGFGSGLNKSQVSDSVGSALPAVASIILIVAAGGGFKQTLIDAGVGNVIKDWAEGVSISVLVLGWLVAVLSGSAPGRPRSPRSPRPASSRRWLRPCRPTTSRCSCWRSAAGRCSSRTSTTPGSGWSRSTSA